MSRSRTRPLNGLLVYLSTGSMNGLLVYQIVFLSFLYCTYFADKVRLWFLRKLKPVRYKVRLREEKTVLLYITYHVYAASCKAGCEPRAELGNTGRILCYAGDTCLSIDWYIHRKPDTPDGTHKL